MVAPRRSNMRRVIRQAVPGDLPAMIDLLVAAGEQRRSSDPSLWRLAADARRRIEAVVRPGFEGSGGRARELWLLAETAGRTVGIAHATIVPVPPIYGVTTGPPGLLLDDCYTTEGAPPGTSEALLLATEAALVGLGVSTLIASCAAASPWRPLFEKHGYEPVTWYLGKLGFTDHVRPSSVRPADAGDIAGIVELSARHRTTLAQLNPRFWRIHPEADLRFGAWMRHSLTLPDRDMMVAGPPGGLHGYIIAQPIAQFLVPSAHDPAEIGVVDDFYDQDFVDVAAVSNQGAEAADLLSAAEGAFVRRSFAAALVVCPAAWASKASVLEQAGYRLAKLWMLKR